MLSSGWRGQLQRWWGKACLELSVRSKLFLTWESRWSPYICVVALSFWSAVYFTWAETSSCEWIGMGTWRTVWIVFLRGGHCSWPIVLPGSAAQAVFGSHSGSLVSSGLLPSLLWLCQLQFCHWVLARRDIGACCPAVSFVCSEWVEQGCIS